MDNIPFKRQSFSSLFYCKTARIKLDNPISTNPRKSEISKTSATTTAVEPIVCLRDGHVTFLSSILTSLKNWIDELKKLVFGFAAATLATWDFFLAVAGFTAGITFFPPAALAVVLAGLAIAA
jgi:hypothetical protein